MFGSSLPSLWSSDNQVYSGRGADTVMQSSDVPSGLQYISRASELPADCLQIVLALLLRVFCGLLCGNIRLQLMDCPAQALSFLSVSDLAAGHIRTRVYTRCVGAETIEIHSQIVAGVKGSKAFIQCREWRTRVGSGSVSGQHSLGSQAGGGFFFYFASASERVAGILGVFLDPLDGIKGMQTVRAILGGSGRAHARGPLRRGPF